MRTLSGRHDSRQIILPVAILGSDEPTDLTYVRASALLDTGATSSGLAPNLIAKLSLRAHEKRPFIVATEQRLVDYYCFRIGLFDNNGAELNGTMQIPFVFAETDGFEISTSHSFDMILGMDVLSQCDFSMSRLGVWELSFG